VAPRAIGHRGSTSLTSDDPTRHVLRIRTRACCRRAARCHPRSSRRSPPGTRGCRLVPEVLRFATPYGVAVAHYRPAGLAQVRRRAHHPLRLSPPLRPRHFASSAPSLLRRVEPLPPRWSRSSAPPISNRDDRFSSAPAVLRTSSAAATCVDKERRGGAQLLARGYERDLDAPSLIARLPSAPAGPNMPDLHHSSVPPAPRAGGTEPPRSPRGTRGSASTLHPGRGSHAAALERRPRVLSYGGGLDRFALLLLALDKRLTLDEVIFVDVGDPADRSVPEEWPSTYRHIQETVPPSARQRASASCGST